MYQSRLHCNSLTADFGEQSNPNFNVVHLSTRGERKINRTLSGTALFEPSINDLIISSEPKFSASNDLRIWPSPSKKCAVVFIVSHYIQKYFHVCVNLSLG
jgi:hypothetical protein